MRNQALRRLIPAVLGAAALLLFWGGLAGPGARRDDAQYSAAGTAMAQAAIGALGPGGKIWLLARDTASFPQPAADIQLTAFERKVREAGVEVAGRRLIQMDPLRPMHTPVGDFLEYARKGRTGDVVVSLVGAPELSDEQLESLGASKAVAVLFCPGLISYPGGLRGMFEQRTLRAAILSRPLSTNGIVHGRAGAETFEDLYLTVTSTNLDALPPPPAG